MNLGLIPTDLQCRQWQPSCACHSHHWCSSGLWSSHSSRYTFAGALRWCPQGSAESEACLLTVAGIAPYSKDHGLLQERNKISRTQFYFQGICRLRTCYHWTTACSVLCTYASLCKIQNMPRGRNSAWGVRGATKDVIWVTKWQWGWRQAMLLWCHLVLALSGRGSLVPFPHGLTLTHNASYREAGFS